MDPRIHIPPRHGIADSRVAMYLPMIVPGDCEIRVGGTAIQYAVDARGRWLRERRVPER